MKKRDKVIMGTVLGGAIGSVLGFMFAPQKGKKTRQDVKDFKDKVYEEHGDTIRVVQNKSKGFILTAIKAIRSKIK